MTDIRRVHEDDLDGGEGDTLEYQGGLFTGVMYCTYPDGVLSDELTYHQGLPKGLCRSWHPNGVLSAEWTARYGHGTSSHTTWRPDGSREATRLHEFGVELSYREWGADGTLVCERALEPGTPQHDLLLKLRARYGPITDY
ncbi:toxin-antitoxin system YwqK family antitoxin [Longispora urticae]